jgi:hypothetical protein
MARTLQQMRTHKVDALQMYSRNEAMCSCHELDIHQLPHMSYTTARALEASRLGHEPHSFRDVLAVHVAVPRRVHL